MKRAIAAMVLIATVGSAAAGAAADLPVTIVAVTPTGPRTVEVRGLLVNSSGKKLSTVAVTVPLYDAGGVRVGQAIATTVKLQAGEKWAFAAPAVSAGGAITKVGEADVLAISE